MDRPLRIAFLGSDAISLPLLNWLVTEGNSLVQIVGVFTQPDRPVGRGQKITANAIKAWALARQVPVFQPEKINEEVRLQLAGLNLDLSLVMAYGHILRDDFITTPRLGTLNLHASILPKYRGASPIQTAIACGEKETGVSLMRIVRRLDAGPVADIERVTIDALDTAIEVEAKLAAACVPLLRRALPTLATASLMFEEQRDEAATFCRRLEKDDGVLDFHAPASTLAARINGLFPWPACSVEIDGQLIKFGAAGVGEPASVVEASEKLSAPGTVVRGTGDGLLINTGAGILRIHRLQRPGGKMLPATEFLRGFAVPVGSSLPSRAMPVLVAQSPFRK